MEHLVLHRQVVDPERLGAVVHCAGGGAIGVRQRVALGNHLTETVERAERFVTHFVVEQDELAEVPVIIVGNYDFPAILYRLGVPWIQVGRTDRLDDERADQAEGGRVASGTALNQMTPFLLINRDVPLEVL